MGSKNDKILMEKACDNAKHISEILKELESHIPEKDRSVTDGLFEELRRRMFYHDVLYDMCGRFTTRFMKRKELESLESLAAFSSVMSKLESLKRTD